MENKKSFLSELEENIMLIPMGISLALMLVSFVIQFFATPEAVVAVQQISYYAYAWVAALALSICNRDNKHLRVPVLEKYLPEQAVKIESLINCLIGLVVLVVMLVFTFQLTSKTAVEGVMDGKAPGLPLAIAYAAPAVGYLISCVRTVLWLMKGEK